MKCTILQPMFVIADLKSEVGWSSFPSQYIYTGCLKENNSDKYGHTKRRYN